MKLKAEFRNNGGWSKVPKQEVTIVKLEARPNPDFSPDALEYIAWYYDEEGNIRTTKAKYLKVIDEA